MPGYKKKVYRKKRTARKVPLKIKKYVSNVIERKKELKIFDLSNLAHTTEAITEFYDLLSGLSRGIQEDEYIGCDLTPKSISIQGFMYNNNTTDSKNCRLTLIRWFNEDDAPTAAEVYNNYAQNSVCLSHFNKVNAGFGEYQILYDKRFILHSKNAYQNNTARFTIRKKLFGKVQWNHAETKHKGGYHLIMSSDSSSYYPTISFTSRFKYTDA